MLFAVQMEKRKVTLTALGLFSGEQVWKQTFKVGKGGHPSPPIVNAREAWHFSGKTARLDAVTGKVLWERNDVILGNRSPPPALSGEKLYLIDSKKTLHVMKTESGETAITAPLSKTVRYTNIYPAKIRLYLRGRRLTQQRFWLPWT